MKRVVFSSIGMLVISFYCYGDVQSDFTSGWQKICDGNFAQARSHYSSVISSEASSPDKANANLRLAWVDVFEAIANGQYAQAKTIVDTLKTQYTGNESLALYIFRTAERMEWKMQFDLAADLYGQVVSQYPDSASKQNAQIGLLSVNTQALLESEDFDKAGANVEEIISNYFSNSKLPDVLYRISEAYRWKGKLEQAQNICQYIIKNNSSWSGLSQVQFDYDHMEACRLITEGKCDQAKVFVDNVKNSTVDQQLVAKGLLDIADRYRWANKLDEAKAIYQQVKSVSGGEFASKSVWYELNIGVLELIDSGKGQEAWSLIQGIKTNFVGNPYLPEMLFYMGERYSWKADYSRAEELFDNVIELSADSQFGQKAVFQKLWVKALGALDSKDYSAAESVTDKLISDYSSNSQLPEVLYAIAERYRWAGRYDKVEAIYQKIINQDSGSKVAGKANLDMAIVNTLAMIEPGNEAQAQVAIDKLVSDLKTDEKLPETLALIGERYYMQGCELESSGNYEQMESYFQRAITMWENAQKQFSDYKMPVGALQWTGDCYRKTGSFDKSNVCYERLLSLYPDYELSWNILLQVGRNYEYLKKNGSIEAVLADAKTREVYEQLVSNYPDAKASQIARRWLTQH